MRTACLVLLALALVVSPCVALIHRLHVSRDHRRHFVIEGFGFAEGGVYSLTMTHVKFEGVPTTTPDERKVGFLIQKGTVDTRELDGASISHDCATFEPTFPLVVPKNVLGGNATKLTQSFRIRPDEANYYTTSFVNCEPVKDVQSVSFTITLAQWNQGFNGKPNYLSIGDTPLPGIYTIFGIAFVYLFCYWLKMLWTAFRDRRVGRVYLIHFLMAFVLLLKAVTSVLHAIDYYQMMWHGAPGAWGVAYDIFMFLKGISLFVVIILIGTGWSFLKPFLTPRERQVLMVVVPLQVLANVALFIVDETSPGSFGWIEWHEIFRFVDLVCCFAVLIPVMWSIQQLKDSALTDGKAARNLEKLKMFRWFYSLVIVYVYTTRVFMYMLQAMLSYRRTWVPEFLTELTTLLFYVITGYLFRPVSDNPYLTAEQDDSARERAERQLREEEADA